MKTLAISISTALAGVVIGSVGIANATTHQTRDLPNWVTTTCAHKGDVNCRQYGKHTHIIREVPGSTHMVCVFYVQPRYAATHDYCS